MNRTERQPFRACPRAPGSREEDGLSAHIVAPVSAGDGRVHGTLVVRYSTSALLRLGLPWWLARKYDVRLVDGFGQTIASAGETLRDASRANWL